ncbi:DsbA family protein [Haloferax sp. YSMS24]|uniref:DsbA family protein n=1 Tax=Haloferax sp. YSMS24 TaxID=3388425 RepID=UPI00398D687F
MASVSDEGRTHLPHSHAEAPVTDSPRLTVPVSDEDHVVGSATAPVTLVQYGDYECPYCGAAYPIVKDVLDELGDDVQFVFRNFPISGLHPHARHAAEAAEAAAEQGMFWEMHDYLYEHQTELEDENLLDYAATLGLDVELVERALETDAFDDRIQADFMSGVRSGVNGTPTFFINGRRYDRPWDKATLTSALEDAVDGGRMESE